MPNNEVLWQGVEVHWVGEIVETEDSSGRVRHGFFDMSCDVVVEIQNVANERLSPNQLASGIAVEISSPNAAVATHKVSGRLQLEDGHIVLVPDQLERVSPWLVEADGGTRRYFYERYSRTNQSEDLK
ncbi:hypothetical protein K3165_13940 [Qipengyuania sp. 1XM1-15A]|uniref:hypothetical protein n=1 Tax=Qipengyuania xiamenensis TaxID=2867237 RepID=UPI001C882AC3|nr:hypothetical protein [Qipengyuania xiamenensis]MBX7534032.1 hypothetical protein [Qipengyuania xiamenensis]